MTARTTQVVVESIGTQPPKVRTTQVVVESIGTQPPKVRTTQVVVEVVHQPPPPRLLSMVAGISVRLRVPKYLAPDTLQAVTATRGTLYTGWNYLRSNWPKGIEIVTEAGGLVRLGSPAPYQPVVYLMPNTDQNLVDMFTDALVAVYSARGEVIGILEAKTVTSTLGDSYVSGSLDSHSAFGGQSEGDSYVSGGLADGLFELAGTSLGGSYVYNLRGMQPIPIMPSAYYFYGNVGVGFEPTDTDPDADEHHYADGHIMYFDRYLYQYVNVGVGFNHTDDASGNPGFVDQTFPDGNIMTDWARYLYQYVNVIIPPGEPEKRLTIGPAPRGFKDLSPQATPPRNPRT